MTHRTPDQCGVSHYPPPAPNPDVGYEEAYDLHCRMYTFPSIQQELHQRGWLLHNRQTAREWVLRGEKIREAELAFLTPKRLRDRLAQYLLQLLEDTEGLRKDNKIDPELLEAKLSTLPHLRGLASDLAKLIGANAPVSLAVANLIPGMPPDMRDMILAGNGTLTGGDLFAATAGTYAAKNGDPDGK